MTPYRKAPITLVKLREEKVFKWLFVRELFLKFTIFLDLFIKPLNEISRINTKSNRIRKAIKREQIRVIEQWFCRFWICIFPLFNKQVQGLLVQFKALCTVHRFEIFIDFSSDT